MSALQVPLEATTSASIVQETELDGTTYRLAFRWNERDAAWYLEVRDLEDVALASGLKLVEGAILLRHLVDERLPPGDFVVINTDAPGETPGRLAFSTGQAVLIYADEEELASPTVGSVVEAGGFSMHGQMSVSVSASTSISSTATKVLGTWVEGLLDSFQLVGNNRLVYIGATERTFLVVAALELKSSGTAEVHMGVYQNGSAPLTGQDITRDMSSALGRVPQALSSLVTLKPNEYIEIWSWSSSAITLTVDGTVAIIG